MTNEAAPVKKATPTWALFAIAGAVIVVGWIVASSLPIETDLSRDAEDIKRREEKLNQERLDSLRQPGENAKSM